MTLEEAKKEFNKGQYHKAAEGFRILVDANANDYKSRSYLAACLLRTGKKEEAMQQYWAIVKRFPDYPETRAIKSYLYKNDSNFSRNAAMNASIVGDNAPGDVEIQNQPSSGKRPTSAIEYANAMVGKVKPLKDRPEVSGLLFMDVKAALSEYPVSVLNLLYSNGCKILITPTYIDRDPQAANTRPEGFEYGSTWKDCPGRFDGRNVIVCEYTIGNGIDLEKASDPIGILRHEIGHAIDRFLGNLSDKTEFKTAYQQDLHRLDEFVMPRLRYYIQTEGNGPAETFAELAAAKYGGKSQSGNRKNRSATIANLVYDNFPTANKVLESKLDSFQ
ncbi:MAG: hypothetical protein SFY67_04180 [Candidatus Melainabacteria bacterium]|nr:hypothetical protein [Candidatus Melainabacteria bacterium]